ncbi:MAG: hypothetical protein GXP49_05520 [Deltaproteobacteria bacterium]|nr:hypothetical protein [Deltaproteobacteria bacterium]
MKKMGIVLCLGTLSIIVLPGCTFQLRPADLALQHQRYKILATYEGIAGVYGQGMSGMGTMQSMPGMHGRRNSLGELWDPKRLTVGHRSWPIGSIVRVTNLDNGRSAVARVTDRIEINGKSRLCDISPGLSTALDVGILGRARVRVEFLEPLGEKNSGLTFMPARTRSIQKGKYRLACGKAMTEPNAMALKKEIIKLTGTAWIEKKGNMFQVYAIASDEKEKVLKIKAQLDSQGYESRIVNAENLNGD